MKMSLHYLVYLWNLCPWQRATWSLTNWKNKSFLKELFKKMTIWERQTFSNGGRFEIIPPDVCQATCLELGYLFWSNDWCVDCNTINVEMIVPNTSNNWLTHSDCKMCQIVLKTSYYSCSYLSEYMSSPTHLLHLVTGYWSSMVLMVEYIDYYALYVGL